MEEIVGSYKYKVEAFHVDYTSQLSFGVLGNQLLNAAGYHADKRGFGKERLFAEGYTWVVSRLAVEMFDYPKEYEEYTIQTWLEGVSRFFTNRNFAILNKEGKPIGYARSIWALIRIDTREPVDLLQFHEGEIARYVCEKECPIAKAGRSRVATTEPVATFCPLYCDIDYNGHLNSIKYLEHMLNQIPLEMFQLHRVRRVEVCYNAECFYKKPLRIFMEKKAENEFDLEIRKEGGETACRGKLFFE